MKLTQTCKHSKDGATPLTWSFCMNDCQISMCLADKRCRISYQNSKVNQGSSKTFQTRIISTFQILATLNIIRNSKHQTGIPRTPNTAHNHHFLKGKRYRFEKISKRIELLANPANTSETFPYFCIFIKYNKYKDPAKVQASEIVKIKKTDSIIIQVNQSDKL